MPYALFREFAIGMNIVADLERAKSDVKPRNSCCIFLRRPIGELIAIATGRQADGQYEAEKNEPPRARGARRSEYPAGCLFVLILGGLEIAFEGI